MNKVTILAIGALVATPALFLWWALHRESRLKAERKLDETLDDSFPASDPPAHRNFTAAG